MPPMHTVTIRHPTNTNSKKLYHFFVWINFWKYQFSFFFPYFCLEPKDFFENGFSASFGLPPMKSDFAPWGGRPTGLETTALVGFSLLGQLFVLRPASAFVLYIFWTAVLLPILDTRNISPPPPLFLGSTYRKLFLYIFCSRLNRPSPFIPLPLKYVTAQTADRTSVVMDPVPS